MTAEVSGLRRRMYEDVDYIYICGGWPVEGEG